MNNGKPSQESEGYIGRLLTSTDGAFWISAVVTDCSDGPGKDLAEALDSIVH